MNNAATKLNDPADWALHDALCLAIAHDYGVKSDHSTIIKAGLWPVPGAGIITAITGIKQLSLNTPPSEVRKKIVEAKMHHGSSRAPTITLVDASSNAAHFESLCQLGIDPMPIGLVSTGATRHSRNPDIIQLGERLYAREYKVSRTLLIDELASAMEQGQLIITKTGDAGILKAEFGSLQRVVTEARNVKFVTPNNTHDDLLISVAMAYYGLQQAWRLKNRFTGVRNKNSTREVEPGSGGWT